MGIFYFALSTFYLGTVHNLWETRDDMIDRGQTLFWEEKKGGDDFFSPQEKGAIIFF